MELIREQNFPAGRIELLKRIWATVDHCGVTKRQQKKEKYDKTKILSIIEQHNNETGTLLVFHMLY